MVGWLWLRVGVHTGPLDVVPLNHRRLDPFTTISRGEDLMLRSRRRSLLCCALAFLLVHAFTPCPLTSSATNVAYAKKAVKKKRRKRKTVGQYVPFVLTTPAVPVASTAPAPPRPSTPAARSFTR